ncbi:MAG: hypothetical protein QXP36_09810 [Conexivisphaerales archaeon]
MVDLVLSNSDSSKRSKAHSSSCLQKPFGRLISSWKTLWSGIQESIRSRSLYEVWEKINQFKDADKFLYTNLPEKNQFAEMFREYLKSKFAEAGVFLDKKKSNLSNLLYSENKSVAYSLAKFVLLYCYLCGVERFPWTFQELETARLINFTFYYDELNTIPTIFFVFRIFQNYKLDLDQKLNPEEVVRHIEQRVISYIFREVRGNLGLLRICFLFFKDNEKLRECFFSRIRTELLCKEMGSHTQKEWINVLNELPFAIEFLESLINESSLARTVFQKSVFELIKKYVKEFTRKLGENSTEIQRLITYLTEKLYSEERYDVRTSIYVSSRPEYDKMSLVCSLYTKDLVFELIEEIRSIGKQLINQKTFEKENEVFRVLLSKVAGIFYLVELSKEVELKLDIETVSQLVKTPKKINDLISRRNFAVSSLREYSRCVDELTNNLNKFLLEKERVLEKIKNLRVKDKSEVLEEYREVINREIKMHFGRQGMFSDETCKEEIYRWKDSKSEGLRLIIKAVDAGKYEKLIHLLNWNWYSLEPTFSSKEEKILLRMVYFYYLIRYIKERQDKRAYQIIKEMLRKRLSIWGYVYFFDDCPDDIEFLRKMKWLNFVVSFLLDLGRVECKWREEDQLLVFHAGFSLLRPESSLIPLIFPDVEYTSSGEFCISFVIKPENIFKLLQDYLKYN